MMFWLNGEYRQDSIAIDIADRGFLLGDGVFETLLLVDGVPLFLREHVERMTEGARTLKLDSAPNEGDVAAVLAELAMRNGALQGAGSARVTLTRGSGPRGLAFTPNEFASTCLITAAAAEGLETAEPVTLSISAHRRNEHSVCARCKTLNYLDNIMAREEAVAAGAGDAIMLNSAGRVACATAANIFVIRNGAVATPLLSEGALPGIVRGALLAAASKEGIEISETQIAPDGLKGASLFLTNSLMGLRSAELLGQAQVSDNSGDIFNRLKSCYARIVQMDIDRRKAAG